MSKNTGCHIESVESPKEFKAHVGQVSSSEECREQCTNKTKLYAALSGGTCICSFQSHLIAIIHKSV